MREQLTQYVNLLFAGAPEAEEIRDEILQNTLDRYDDLIAQGKQPEAAYRLAISGIGDINEILHKTTETSPGQMQYSYADEQDTSPDRHRKYRAIAIAMYILCPVPLFILSEFGMGTLGLCLTLGLVAAATYAIMLGKSSDQDDTEEETSKSALPPERRRIADWIRTISLAVFLILSFVTGAWYITWLIFPIAACVRGLIFAIMDLKEVS